MSVDGTVATKTNAEAAASGTIAEGTTKDAEGLITALVGLYRACQMVSDLSARAIRPSREAVKMAFP